MSEPVSHSATPLGKKLGWREGLIYVLVGEPPEYAEWINGFPSTSRKAREGEKADLIHLFTGSRSDLEIQVPALRKWLQPGGKLWVSWPKAGSGVACDFVEDDVRRLAALSGLVDVKVCAVSPVYGGLLLVIPKALRK